VRPPGYGLSVQSWRGERPFTIDVKTEPQLFVGDQGTVTGHDIVRDQLRQTTNMIQMAMGDDQHVEVKGSLLRQDCTKLGRDRRPVVPFLVISRMAGIDENFLSGALNHDAIAIFRASHIQQMDNQ
jgi:hypothetical protein